MSKTSVRRGELDRASPLDDLYHRATPENQNLALAGQPWVTRCGQIRVGLRRKRIAEDSLDVCAICVHETRP